MDILIYILLIIACPVVNGQDNSDPWIYGYDCSSSDFIMNISISTDTEEHLHSPEIHDSKFQLLQYSTSEKVTSHEILLERSIYVQTCGDEANTHKHWYHEILLDINIREPILLNSDQIQDIVLRNRLQVGQEWGFNKGRVMDIHLGHQTLQLLGVGNINYGYYSDGKPLCKGGVYTLKSGHTVPKALVWAVYQVRYLKKTTHLLNTKVLSTGFNQDCHLEHGQKQVLCYDSISGVNFFIKRNEASNQECNLVPTRKSIVEGKTLIDKERKMFISDEAKILLTLKENTDCCGCESCFDTNIPGLKLLDSQKCTILGLVNGIPAVEVNLEYNNNVRLDYLRFKTENSTGVE